MDTFRLHKDNEKAAILASASITAAERRGIGGYVGTPRARHARVLD